MKMRVNNKILLWYNNKMKISLGGIVFMAKKGFGGGMMPGGGTTC